MTQQRPKRPLLAKAVVSTAVAGLLAPFVAGAGVPPEPERPWTDGTTEAANQVVGDRSGLSFVLIDAPDTSQPRTLEVSVAPSNLMNQQLDVYIDAPDTLEATPALRIDMTTAPPDGTTPPRVELHVLDPGAVTIFGPDGQAASVCPAPR